MEKILLSPRDEHLLDAHTWSIRRNGKYTCYAVTWINGKYVRMHRHIMQALPAQVVDHINGNGLDNRRENLRIVTRRQNNHNARCYVGVSKFKGVSKHQNTTKWRAYICVDHKQIHLGYFISEIEAARAYNEAAKNHFGEYARLNEC